MHSITAFWQNSQKKKAARANAFATAQSAVRAGLDAGESERSRASAQSSSYLEKKDRAVIRYGERHW